ncbi:MAG: hypothetical protein J2P21_08955 [Chloracidobacterium sp.]|nr:hypothetical protein [Chloracidobacterium sp.]
MSVNVRTGDQIACPGQAEKDDRGLFLLDLDGHAFDSLEKGRSVAERASLTFAF